MPTTNLLTFDFRVGVLFLSLFLGQPWLFPAVECTLMEWWRKQMKKSHEQFCAYFLQHISDYES